MEQQLTPEHKIETEIRLYEAQARLCRTFAVKIPEEARYWLKRADHLETTARNSSLFLRGREMSKRIHPCPWCGAAPCESPTACRHQARVEDQPWDADIDGPEAA